MHLILRKAATAACLLLAASGAQAADPLQNAIVSASYSAGGVLALSDEYAGTTSTSWLDPLDTSVEFFTDDLLFGFDFSADGHLTIYNNAPVTAGATYSASFDFGATLGGAIKSFVVSDAGLTSGVPVLTVINDHTIAIDFSGVEWHGDFGTLQTAIALQTSAVPEPSAALLMVAGLMLLRQRARRA